MCLNNVRNIQILMNINITFTYRKQIFKKAFFWLCDEIKLIWN